MAKNTSLSNYKKYDKYRIPKTSMTPWVRNLISNSWINFFPTLVKLHTNHALAWMWKNKIKDLEKKIKIQNKNGKVLRDYFSIGFSPMIQQQKHFLVTNLQMLTHYPNIMAFTWKDKCWTPKFKLGIHHIWIFSCFNSNNDLKAQNLFDMTFEV